MEQIFTIRKKLIKNQWLAEHTLFSLKRNENGVKREKRGDEGTRRTNGKGRAAVMRAKLSPFGPGDRSFPL